MPEDEYNRLMNATYESVMSSQVAEVDDDLESLLDQREAEVEGDPSLEISHETFIGHFSKRRSS